MVAEVIETMSLREQEIQDHGGHWYALRVRPYRTTEARIDGAVLIFIDIDAARRAYAELQHEQDFTSAVLESAAALVMVTDLEGRILRFNLACRRLTGYSPEEVFGQRVSEMLVPPEEAEAVEQIYQELAAGGDARENENHWVDRHGQRHLISWSSTVIARNSTRYMVRVGVDITRARLAEQALQQSEHLLLQSQRELRALTAGLLTAQEDERSRVARELHDDIGQRLTALAIEVEVLHQALGLSPDDLGSKLGGLREQIEGLSEDLRRAARDLHPFTLTHLGLEPALRSYCAEFSRQRGIKVRFAARTLPASIPPAAALCVFRVVQEALGNIARHASAKRALVAISGDDAGLHAVIRDDGHGFDLTQARGKGLGLISMEERVRHAGGTLQILPKPGDGTRIEIHIPPEVLLPVPAAESGAP